MHLWGIAEERRSRRDGLRPEIFAEEVDSLGETNYAPCYCRNEGTRTEIYRASLPGDFDEEMLPAGSSRVDSKEIRRTVNFAVSVSHEVSYERVFEVSLERLSMPRIAKPFALGCHAERHR